MLHMRPSDPFETVVLNQPGDPEKPSLHVERQLFKLSSHAIIEQLYGPRHPP